MNGKSLTDLLTQADIYARNAEWENTLDTLKQVMVLDKEHSGALTGIGTSLIHLEHPEEAIDTFKKVVQIEPDSPEAQNNLGVAFAMLSQLDAAEIAYKNAIELDSEHTTAWKNLAQIYLQQLERLSEGIQILAAIIQKDPNDVEAAFMLAECYEEANDIASAEFLYKRVLKNQPEYPAAVTALARLTEKKPDPVMIARPEHAKKLAGLKKLKGFGSSKEDT